ncbi:MAG: SidA/IucD/PvdA family monooxygenase, partial [Cyclobacteriaceae bacterium]
AKISGFTRRYGYLQKDVNPFTGEVYFPEFIDLFFRSGQQVKDRLIRDLHLTNYSASDYDVLDKLYRKIYLQKVRGTEQMVIHRSADIQKVNKRTDKIAISYTKLESPEIAEESFDLVVLATGFKNTGTRDHEEQIHPLLSDLKRYLSIDQDGNLPVNLDYSLQLKNRETSTLFLNGLCESSHGMGDAGSFSLLALRSQRIVESLDRLLKEKNAIYNGDYDVLFSNVF